MAWYQHTLFAESQVPIESMTRPSRTSDKKGSPPGVAVPLSKGVRGLRAAANIRPTTALRLGVRTGARVGLRFVPVLGTVLLVHDAYQLGKWLLD